MNETFASRVLDLFERRFLAEGVLRALGVLVLLALGVLVVLGLWVAPPDVVQGDAQRLMYVHVPTAIMAFAAFAITTATSILYLWRRTRDIRWDRLAAVSAELGVLFTSVTLVLGMLWGRPVWGVFWTWDARLVTTAVLLFLWMGYLALRRMIADPGTRARRCAVAAIVAFIDVPIVQLSVEWWRSLHQQSTLATLTTNDPQIEGMMLVALLWSLAAFGLAYLYLLARRYQLAVVEEGIEDRMLDAAIAERRAEADFSPPLTAIEAEVG